MRNDAEFLSLPRLLESCHKLGLDINERKLHYYIHRGLIPKGVKRPELGADGRAGYWPATVVKRLRRICQLKQQGYKLDQIRKFIEGEVRPVNLDEPVEEPRRELALRYLKQCSDGTHPEAVQQLERQLPSDDASWTQAWRSYHRTCLEALLGAEEAERHLAEFVLHSNARELQRAVARFRRRWEPLLQQLQSPFLQVDHRVREVLADVQLGRIEAAEARAFLASLLEGLLEFQAPLAGSPGATAALAAAAVAQALEALQVLVLSLRSRTALQQLGLALQKLHRCRRIERELLELQGAGLGGLER